MNVPDFMPRLRSGAGDTPKDGGCLVQVAGFLNDGVSWVDDTPCVHPMLRSVGILTNDSVDGDMRQELLPLAPRLIGTGLTGDVVEDRRVMTALVEWCVRDAQWSGDPEGAATAARYAEAYRLKLAVADTFDFDPQHYAGVVANIVSNSAARVAGIGCSGRARVGFLVRLIDEYDRITGREVSGKTVSDADWKRVTEHIKANA
ncbi:hypothetical protein ACFWPU_00665 [Streptomyces sp. NPDC058471]|uniref:hypothetical protein n=1 Tax=Streptomyces sp. NPDC058471 TaxID=3346516 RepID=UPI0036684C79